MSKIKVTRAEYEVLKEEFEDAEERFQKAMRDKGEAHRRGGGMTKHENPAAEEAYERMEMWSKRMSELRADLFSVEVVEAPTSKERLQIGHTVTLLIDDEEVTVLMSGPKGRWYKGQLANTSLVGSKVIGQKVGFETEVKTSVGATYVRILSIK